MTSINEISPEQIQELLTLSKRLREQELQQDRSDQQDLPKAILKDVANSLHIELKNKLKKFAQDTIKYDGRAWTKSEAVNKLYIPELKWYQVDAVQMVTSINKASDRLRTAGRSATKIYQDFEHLIEEGGNKSNIRTVLEKTRHLSVYSFAISKELENDAKDIITQALHLPESLRYLEDKDEQDKDLVFSANLVERIQQTHFDEAVIKNATARQFGGFGNNRGTTGRNRFRGRGYTGEQRGNFSWGRGQELSNLTQQHIANHNAQSNPSPGN
ncbi:hypothetical protein PHYBLDRAFT_170444 [Phycomyces blakesleeanus NRRL 1555(-)]|uniref:Uncharacterized protein n=1 Tax=Phycomyces blakesleeanus (strain ATCC 8743b / DSM 1359 / FGSC 10004 / NBRC 33097 / NRRL 1555) TaxID=763407 RepID=A0A163DJX5_PHYB8|nr:hypothetical protein PHYBLDRAFT_170444 [Phycomyces blakesleeanus NRRL 1555(-)]OAD71790.1 hypothetical protein PHYBLDRAFT_170444 [Phycomyces blakesleeanus NRRL 1555(-)]|eukprot:XP_018289830.1 hypothetical protein PHYBLDRAFT_170444 [Phycomyces blakesleeanus NRRL 1555(-)]